MRHSKPTPIRTSETPAPAPGFDLLVAARRQRPPLSYSASLASFHCFCDRPHVAAETVIECACGRRWAKL